MEEAAPRPAPGPGDPASRYRERPPCPALAPCLVCTWSQVIGDLPRDHPHRVLPDGCVDLVWIGDAAPIAVGPSTHAFIASLPPRAEIAGVRFRPGWAAVALGAPASELLDRDVPLRELWGGEADAMADRAGPGTPAAARAAALERALLARIRRGAWRADPLAAAAAEWLARRPGERVARLARELGVSPRHLQRRFAAAVGYAPKTFQRIARFQRLLALGGPRERPAESLFAERPARPGRGGLSQLALAAGYADQAHMTREVRELAGRTPAALVGAATSTLPVTDTTPARP